MQDPEKPTPKPVIDNKQSADEQNNQDLIEELDGAARLEPTRYGDWENKGRCIDF